MPARATSTAAPADATAARFRRAHRRARRAEWLAPGRHRLVGHPALDVLDQLPGRGVAVGGLERHRLQADRLERTVDRRFDLPRSRELAALHGSKHRADVVALDRWLSGQQTVQRGAQAENVAARPSASRLPSACSGLM